MSKLLKSFLATKTLLQTAEKYELFDMFVNNCGIVFSKKEYSKLITETMWEKEEGMKWRVFLSEHTDVYFTVSFIQS